MSHDVIFDKLLRLELQSSFKELSHAFFSITYANHVDFDIDYMSKVI